MAKRDDHRPPTAQLTALELWLAPRVLEISAMVPVGLPDVGPRSASPRAPHGCGGWIDDLKDVLRLHRANRHSEARGLFVSVMQGLDDLEDGRGLSPGVLTRELLGLLWSIGCARRMRDNTNRPSHSRPGMDAGPHLELVLMRVVDDTIGAAQEFLGELGGVEAIEAAISGAVPALDAATGLCGMAALFFVGEQLARSFEFLAAAVALEEEKTLPGLVSAVVWLGLVNHSIHHAPLLESCRGPTGETLLAVLGGALDGFEFLELGQTSSAKN